jgi:hypothetical protein
MSKRRAREYDCESESESSKRRDRAAKKNSFPADRHPFGWKKAALRSREPT